MTRSERDAGDAGGKRDPNKDGSPSDQASGPPSVVGIGSSAGGYEAAKELFSNVPADTGMAFVLVAHMDPSHESHLADLLRRDSNLSVAEAEHGLTVEPDHLYVIPPNTSMAIEDGVLTLGERTKSQEHAVHVIDRFFRSLADNYEDRAVGIVLSGALADGTQGVRDIKAAGGFALVQDPKTATFPDMPRSAIHTGVVDVVGSPSEIAGALTDLRRSLPAPPAEPSEEEQAGEDTGQALEMLLEAVQKATGTDFRGYKQTTLMRRIQRRMVATRTMDLTAYARLVSRSVEEADLLHREMLILVTGFFRSEAITQAVVQEALPALFKDRDPDEPVRVWVAGCSTGEEAYSLAILITEYMERHKLSPQLTVIATDLSSQAIRTAREGIYPESIAEDVSEERLARFFEPTGTGYRIRKHIRGLCVFAEHNIVRDAPFSNMDMASCRNVLVYMKPDFQRRAFEALHYALNTDGILILGSAEAIGGNKDLFAPFSDAKTLLRKREVPKGRVHDFIKKRMPLPGTTDRRPREGGSDLTDMDREIDRLLLERYAPPGVVVDQAMNVQYFRGQTAEFLKHRTGPANLDLTQLVPDALALKARDAVRKADKNGTSVGGETVSFEHQQRSMSISIEVIPLRQKKDRESYYLITFTDQKGRHQTPSVRPSGRAGLFEVFFGQKKETLEKQVLGLQEELKQAREHLRHVIADHEAVNEELRSTNEEAVSTNEELQSTNEELETTKEELQSTNEELTTLNEELHIRNQNLQEVNDDLLNLLHSVELPIIMLGSDLTIRRFTDRAKELFNLIHTDVGRPLTDIHASFDVTSLKKDLVHVLKTFQQTTSTIRAKGTWTLKIHPYRTSDNEVAGVVLVAMEKAPGDLADE